MTGLENQVLLMKIKMKKGIIIIGTIFLIMIIAIIGFYFFSQNNNNSNQINTINPEDVVDYIGEQTTIIHRDFKAIMKDDWSEAEVLPATYIYLPKNTKQEDVSAEIISIEVQFLGEDNQYTLDELLELGIENSKQIMSDFELTENIDGGKSDMQGKRIKFTGTQEGVKRNNVQVFGIKYNNLYAITYSCPIDSCNSYAVYNTFVETFEPVQAEIKE